MKLFARKKSPLGRPEPVTKGKQIGSGLPKRDFFLGLNSVVVSTNLGPFPFIITFECFLYIVSDSFEFYHEELLQYQDIDS